jgi:hypothetical protein
MSDGADTEELLARLTAGPPKTTLSGPQATQAWATANAFYPGLTKYVTGSMAVKHYEDWCRVQGYSPQKPPQFLHTLVKLGFTRSRTQKGGKDRTVYLMDAWSVDTFKKWVAAGGFDPIRDNLPSTQKSNVQKAIEELGVKL